MLPVEALTRRRSRRIEIFRVGLLVAAALTAVLPFLTSRLVGGVDGRWYAYMLRGFVDQIGSGHFPFMIGQGPFAWNGGVHPFRSAPVYMLLGGLWKLITFGRAGTFTLEHLTVATSAVGGTLAFYWSALDFLRPRRWTAAAFALLYLSIPSWLATVYKGDAYMSYMAFGAMPLVLFGNARTLVKTDTAGYLTLAAGLALIWMCHPPIALLSTTATLFIQAAAVIIYGLENWRRAALGVLAFGALAAYYFVSMAELPPRPDGGASGAAAVIILVGIAVLLVGIGRAAFVPGKAAWAAVAVLGLLIIAARSQPWMIWGCFTMGFAAVAAALVRKANVLRAANDAPIITFFCALLAAAAAEAVLGKGHPGINGGAVSMLASNAAQLGSLLRPLPLEMDSGAVFQPGWSVLLASLLGLCALGTRGQTASRIFGAAAVVFFLCLLRLPLVSNFLVGYYPPAFGNIVALPLPLRLAPVLASVGLMAGLLWFAERRFASRRRVVLAGAMLWACVLWSGYQVYNFIRIGFLLTSSAAVTEQSLRPENVVLDRYAYDLLNIPDYYTNGIADPALESRLLRPDQSVLVGPEDAARALEKMRVMDLKLVGKVIPGSASWLDVSPNLEVKPGEHLLLRFQFDPGLNYGGYLIFFAEHAYREYHLPDSGQPLAFGVGGHHSSVISLWNSGATTEHYHLSISREPGNTLDERGGFIANLAISEFDPKALPVRLLSAFPYHVLVKAPSAATLETFRIFLPGYRAYVDGVEVPVWRSKQALLSLAVPLGLHDVVVEFRGTLRLWFAGAVSALAWLAFLCAWGTGKLRSAVSF